MAAVEEQPLSALEVVAEVEAEPLWAEEVALPPVALLPFERLSR